jgi:hypothetical protein
MLVKSQTDFRPGRLGAGCCTLGLVGSRGEKKRGSSFDPSGTAPKCPSRLGGLKIAGSRADGIPGGILLVFLLGHLGLAVGGVSSVVG